MDKKINDLSRFAVVGYGSWATAIVSILTDNQQNVNWYISNREVSDAVLATGRNPRYLSQLQLDNAKLEIFSDLRELVDRSDVIIFAVPSAFLELALEGFDGQLDGKFIISAIKGIVPGSLQTVSEYFNGRYGVPYDSIGIIAGPCHSEEVALRRLSYLTLVCKNEGDAEILCEKFRTSYIHANPSTDIYGTEYASVLKNIYAIGAGIACGLGYGDNFLSVLVCNSAMEMSRFLSVTYDSFRDTASSPYLGDLLVTCFSRFSRNRRFGDLIGTGHSAEQAMDEMKMVAEGYYGSRCIHRMNAQFGVEMPIAEAVYRILYEGQEPAGIFRRMSEDLY